MTKALSLAVVGHTNVGKTSLLRTLSRDSEFGQVSHRPSTTRHVEGVRLSVDGEALLELYDTPGLEDAIALLDYVEQLERPGERLDGPAKLSRFLDSSEARQRFEQEAKVLRQLLASDAGVYLIDAREPVLAKYRDELALLASCGKPLLPVLNFVAADNQQIEAWRSALARLGLHAVVRFDTVAPAQDGERLLYESLALLLESHKPQLQRLIADLHAQVLARRHSGHLLISTLLLDCAACRWQVSSAQVQTAIHELHNAVRLREQRCVEALLRLYAFRAEDAASAALPLLDGRWGDDLFNPETLKQLGIKVGSGVAAGAAAGAGVDLLVGGLSLGAATLLGAIAGGGLQTARSYGARLLGKVKGQRELTVDDGVLLLLAARQQQLLNALGQRGHAAQHAISLPASAVVPEQSAALLAALRKARAHPEWSALNPQPMLAQAERQALIEAFCAQLEAPEPRH
jgi:small GTP-binding protein